MKLTKSKVIFFISIILLSLGNNLGYNTVLGLSKAFPKQVSKSIGYGVAIACILPAFLVILFAILGVNNLFLIIPYFAISFYLIFLIFQGIKYV